VGRPVSLQVAILRVLSSYPGGRATLAAMNADLALLAGSGPEWTQRLKRLSARVPDIDIFGQRLVVRDAAGWQLTEAGSRLLAALELPAAAASPQPQPQIARPEAPLPERLRFTARNAPRKKSHRRDRRRLLRSA